MTATEGGDAGDGRSCRADFTFLQELGRGTWGTVHVARRRQDGQLYAIKAVALATMGRKDQMAAVAEAQMLASLDSPHIVRYYDSYLHQGQLHIVQEYCAGGSLHAAIRAAPRPLAEDTIWRVLLHTALALHHMHGRRMLHRDVKSMNIFIVGSLEGASGGGGGSSGCPGAPPPSPPQFRLGDVGVSKVLEEGRSHASTLIGTPYYLSPELAQELPYGAPSDMWALGVLLYECVTRRHPFDGQSQASLILKIMRGRYEPLIGLGPDLTAIIHRCLSTAAARRPSAEGLLGLPAVRAKAAELGIELPPLKGNNGGPGGARQAARATEPPREQPAGPALAPIRTKPGPPRRLDAAPSAGPVQPDSEARRPLLSGRRRGAGRPPLPPRPAAAQGGACRGEAGLEARLDAVAIGGAADEQGHAPADELQTLVRVRSNEARQTAAAAASRPASLGKAGAAANAAPSDASKPCRHTSFSVAHIVADAQAQACPAVPVPAAPSGAAVAQRRMESDGGTACQLDGSCANQDSDGDGSLMDSAAAVAGWSGEDSSDSSDDGSRDGSRRASADRVAALRLQQRCVALLGSEALCEELLCVARAAAGGEGGATLADLSDQLFKRLGYSGRAAEVLHLLLKMMCFGA